MHVVQGYSGFFSTEIFIEIFPKDTTKKVYYKA